MAFTIGVHKELFVDHSMVAPHDSHDLVATFCGGSHDGSDAGIHPRGISTTAKHSNFHHFVHKKWVSLLISYLNIGRFDRSSLKWTVGQIAGDWWMRHYSGKNYHHRTDNRLHRGFQTRKLPSY
jgi:hypothetical protein